MTGGRAGNTLDCITTRPGDDIPHDFVVDFPHTAPTLPACPAPTTTISIVASIFDPSNHNGPMGGPVCHQRIGCKDERPAFTKGVTIVWYSVYAVSHYFLSFFLSFFFFLIVASSIFHFVQSQFVLNYPSQNPRSLFYYEGLC